MDFSTKQAELSGIRYRYHVARDASKLKRKFCIAFRTLIEDERDERMDTQNETYKVRAILY